MFATVAGAHGLFSDLTRLLPELAQPVPVNVAQLNVLLSQQPLLCAAGLKFVPQDDSFDWQGQYYEEVIATRNIIPTRGDNWHDIFNAAIWLLFPRTKRLLNQLHQVDIALHGLKKRTRRRDAITLFDECGVVFATSDESCIQQLRQHQWQQVLFDQRSSWKQVRQAFMFGHANYEMALKPFIGLTGKLFPLLVSDTFFDLGLAEQYQYLDEELSAQIAQQGLLDDNRHMSPLPLLGVPGWYEDNQALDFYLNTKYFRPLASHGKQK